MAPPKSKNYIQIDLTVLSNRVMNGVKEVRCMKITEIPAKEKERKSIRVAAYARVSSDKDAAFHSLEAQTEYYRDYVAVHPDWE